MLWDINERYRFEISFTLVHFWFIDNGNAFLPENGSRNRDSDKDEDRGGEVRVGSSLPKLLLPITDRFERALMTPRNATLLVSANLEPVKP